MKISKVIGLTLLALCLTLPLSLAAKDVSYSNPVIPGDYPDPSVIRVGRTYWATATTSDWAPLFPILRSTDLVNWQQVGNVFNNRPDWAVGRFWAPEISEYKGKYYVYYVGLKRNGPLSVAVATADKPEGPYTDHGPLISQEDGSIDPVTIEDENGQRYLIWKEDGNSRKLPTPIWAQKLSNDGTKLEGQMHELIRNDAPWEANLVEGPFLLKRNGWFYMFYSGNGCCGRNCNYGMGVARSQKLLGPWEKYSGNPILIGNEEWKCPGHGSIVSDPQNRDYLLYHAYNAKEFTYVGRQALLEKVDWSQDGWPVINQRNGPSTNAIAPFGHAATHAQLAFEDLFSKPEIKSDWQWPQAQPPNARIEKGWLLLHPTVEKSSDMLGGVMAIKSTSGDYEAVTSLDRTKLSGGAMAGLSAFGDVQNALGVAMDASKIIIYKRQNGKTETLASEQTTSRILFIRMNVRSGHKFNFSISDDRKHWMPIGSAVDLEGAYLPPWDRGIRIALTVGGAPDAEGRFDYLRIDPKSSN